MPATLSEDLIDSVYRVVLEPEAWGDVMELMGKAFPSSAQTFYYLHRDPRRVQPVCLAGVEPSWLRTFNELYFAVDNPWIRLTKRLHVPGVVRTNERLDEVLHDRGALYRSSYCNDWMRPQGFRFTIGNTVLSEGDLVANITLFRPPGMKTFSEAEVRAFEALSRHMTRALQMAVRLERPQSVPFLAAALDAIAHPVGLIDRQRRLRYANLKMESLLRRRAGLALRAGELVATSAKSQQALTAFLDRLVRRASAAGKEVATLALRDEDGRSVALSAVPIGSGSAQALASMPTYLLTVTEAGSAWAPADAELRSTFGCTRAESRLAQLLVEGHDLRSAATAMGVTYGTVRGYLKRVFAKTAVHTQAQLVALMVRGGLPRRGQR
jgi:DNA-binding CsgD family transcriptional regulator